MLEAVLSLDQDGPMSARSPTSSGSTGESDVNLDHERITQADLSSDDDERPTQQKPEPKSPPLPSSSSRLSATDERETTRLPEAPVGSFPKEADTLTAHSLLPGRRDTMPIPKSAPAILAARPLVPPPPPPMRSSPRAMLAAPPVAPALLDDEDLIEDEDDDRSLDDDTQTEVEPFQPSEDPTSPTLSLEHQSKNAREVYRLFLASEYAPALALANELIAQGDNDPMLVTIARECRSSLMGSSAPPASGPSPDGVFATMNVHGKMTLEQLTTMTGMSLEQVLGLLERFVAMGVLTLRPPPRP